MKTTLNADGQIGIPQQIRAGHYLLAKQQPAGARFNLATADDGLPVIRVVNGAITSRLVKEIESQTP